MKCFTFKRTFRTSVRFLPSVKAIKNLLKTMQTFTFRIYDLHQRPVTKFHDASELLLTVCCAKKGLVVGTSIC